MKFWRVEVCYANLDPSDRIAGIANAETIAVTNIANGTTEVRPCDWQLSFARIGNGCAWK